MNCDPCGEGGTRTSTAALFITSVPRVPGQRPLDQIDIGGKGEMVVDHHGDTALSPCHAPGDRDGGPRRHQRPSGDREHEFNKAIKNGTNISIFL
jgi:hypothetical protein